MEYPFSSNEAWDAYPSVPRDLMDVPSMEIDVQDMDLLNFDAYDGWCNNFVDNMTEQMLPSFVSSPLATLPEIFSPFDDESNFIDSYSEIFAVNGNRDKFVSDNDGASMIMMIPRFYLHSLSEKMLKAMHLFKELCGDVLLAQLWVPERIGNEYILTTSEQPYFVDQNLEGYREVSRSFVFSANSEIGPSSGLPGRVFVSRMAEWTADVMFYNKTEYLRSKHADDHKVRGCIALPVFEDDSLDTPCAVLELVTLKEKPNFDLEMENVCRALEAVTLTSKKPPRLCAQTLSKNKKAALAEVKDVLRAVCHAHQLPLALTWIPCNYSKGVGEETIKIHVIGYNNNTSPNEKCVLCVVDTASYVNDKDMQSFMDECAKHYLEEGQGIVGKALQSNHQIFNPNVEGYHVSEYPFVHHVRNFGLSAATAIRLRSSYTCDDDYILELFLPVNMKGSTEQQDLLSNLSINMQKLYKSLRTVEFLRVEDSIDEIVELCERSCEESFIDGDSTYFFGSTENASQQPMAGSKRSRSEKHVPFDVIQQHFSWNLKDAAKDIGVSQTTLKKNCRAHGISRWPCRKINKVNRSLRKTLDSSEGMEIGKEFLVDGYQMTGANWTTSTRATESSLLTIEGSHGWIPSRSSNFTITVGTETKWKNDDFIEHNQHTLSGMMGSSNEFGSRSGSMSNDSSLILRSMGERQNPKIKGVSGSKIIVKAIYKGDITRFKFDHSGGCMELYEEVAKRLNRQVKQFQLKYVDDEEEWVVENDSDLLKCIEILNLGKRSMKLMVRDEPCIMPA